MINSQNRRFTHNLAVYIIATIVAFITPISFSACSSSGPVATATSGAGCGGSACAPIEREAENPIPMPYTAVGGVETPCTTDDECLTKDVALCRYANCDTVCGVCVFVDPWRCDIDSCPGHNETCKDVSECTDGPDIGGSALFKVDCIDGSCLVLPPDGSDATCVQAGKAQFGDGGT